MNSYKEIYDVLSEDERKDLQKLKPTMLKESLTPAIERSLIEKGLAEQKLGGLDLTTKGKLAASLLPEIF